MDAAREHGVVVSGTASSPTPPTELTWALILGLAPYVVGEDAAVRSGAGRARSARTCTDLARAHSRDHRSGSHRQRRRLDRPRLRHEGAGVEQQSYRRAMARSRSSPRGILADPASRERRRHHPSHARRTEQGPDRGPRAGSDPRVGISRQYVAVGHRRLRRTGGRAGRGPHRGCGGWTCTTRSRLPADDALRSAPRTQLTPRLGHVTRDRPACLLRRGRRRGDRRRPTRCSRARPQFR